MPAVPPAVLAGLMASALLLVMGLATGVWKFAQIWQSPQGQAHRYVDVAHRAALMYAYTCLCLAALAAFSALPPAVNLAAVLLPAGAFVLSVTSYVVHGALRDTDNQFRAPHRLGSATLARPFVMTMMVLKASIEIGGVLVLVGGVLSAWLARG